MLVSPHTDPLAKDFDKPGVHVGGYYSVFPHGLGDRLEIDLCRHACGIKSNVLW